MLPLNKLLFINDEMPGPEEARALAALAHPNHEFADRALCHEDFRSVIRSYSTKWVTTEILLKRLKDPPSFKSEEKRLTWCRHAWSWLAEVRSSDDGWHLKLEDLAIIPLSDKLVTKDEAKNLPYLIPAKFLISDLPDWIQINGLPSSFARWIENDENRLGSLTSDLGIETYSERSVVEAFGRALPKKQTLREHPSVAEYLEFSRSRCWPNHSDLETYKWPLDQIKNLPIPTADTNERDSTHRWRKAASCYFGEGWDGHDLQVIFEGVSDVDWADPSIQNGWPEARQFLEICGVTNFPKLSPKEVSSVDRASFWSTIRSEIPTDQVSNRNSPETSHDGGSSPQLEDFVGITVGSLNRNQSSALLRTLKAGWDSYYSDRAFITLKYSKYSWSSAATAPNVWLRNLRDNLNPSVRSGKLIDSGQLGKLWVAGPETPDWALALFPTLEIDKNDPAATDFQQWIISTKLVRTRPADIPYGEWESEIFPALTRVPENTPTAKCGEIAKIATNVYRGYLDRLKKAPSTSVHPPRVTWASDRDAILYAESDKTVWAVSSEADVRNWKAHLPVFLFRKEEIADENFSKLGYRILDDDLEVTLGTETRYSEDVQKTDYFQCFAAWVYVSRSNDLSDRPPLNTWKKIKISVSDTVRVNLTIKDRTRSENAPYHYDSASNLLIVTVDTWNSPHLRASAIIQALDLPASYKDRIEILLGLSEPAREERLVDEGFVRSDIETWLDDYRGNGKLPPLAEEIVPHRSADQPPTGTPADQGSEPTSLEEIEELSADPVPLHGLDVQPHFPEEEPPVAATDEKIKNTGFSGNGGGNGQSKRKPPPDALDVEETSRVFVERKLSELGYDVTQMTQKNPGFDIEAKRGKETLIVEVKGSKQADTKVHLTPPELEIARSAGGSYRWQLWHVCCLATQAGEHPEIRVYETIPDDALTPESFLLDLGACKQITHDAIGLVTTD